jgi:hypothetical protein
MMYVLRNVVFDWSAGTLYNDKPSANNWFLMINCLILYSTTVAQRSHAFVFIYLVCTRYYVVATR